MEALSRQEYPAMLVSLPQTSAPGFPLTIKQGSLQPAQAVSVLSERIKRIGRVNVEIADWLQVLFITKYGQDTLIESLQERRKVEDAYVLGLKKLAHKQPPDSHSELG
jgi:F-BAR domain only protein